MYDEKICRYTLNRIFGYRPKIAHALVDSIGSASEVFRIGSTKLKEMLPYTKDICLLSDREYEKSYIELKRLEAAGIRFICNDDAFFPALLKECEDHPMGLYVRSESPFREIFTECTNIAVIGTRDISPYGREWCERIVSSLPGTSPETAVISGLAIGTDITAHRTALKKGVRTIAVIPTGIDGIYPYRHLSEAERIASSPGCAIVTDYPPQTKALKINFLRRNRIIAGLCRATILVESKVKGGGMTTARLAFSYSRDVYALPGRADDIRSQGCNLLIKEKIAEPIFSEQALLESLSLQKAIESDRNDAYGKDTFTKMYSGTLDSSSIDILSRIVLAIKSRRGITIEETAQTLGISYRQTSELVCLLECDGIISTDLMQRCFIKLQ